MGRESDIHCLPNVQPSPSGTPSSSSNTGFQLRDANKELGQTPVGNVADGVLLEVESAQSRSQAVDICLRGDEKNTVAEIALNFAEALIQAPESSLYSSNQTASSSVTGLTRSSTEVMNFLLPPPDAVSQFSGAWEFIPEEGRMHPNEWLRSFVITGRLCSSGDGSECYLSYREYDNAVMLHGGVLSIEQEYLGYSVLRRSGQSGQVVRFRPFNLPPMSQSARLQGIWHAPDGCPSMRILGTLWQCGSSRGILKYRGTDTEDSSDECILMGAVEVVLDDDDAVLTCSGQKRVIKFER